MHNYITIKSVQGRTCLAAAQAKASFLGAFLTFAMITSLVRGADQTAEASTGASAMPNKADELILKSHQFVSDAHSFEIIETKVDTMKPLVNGQPAGSGMSQTNIAIVRVINGDPMIVDLTTHEPSGRELRVLRRGKIVVMKVGSEPWQVPTGAYAQIKEQMADPYACPLPHGGSNSPQWRLGGTATEEGEECDVVETVGETALDYVRGKIIAGFATAFPDPAARPTITVQSYKSRLWIQRTDGKRLRVEQSGLMRMSMPQPKGGAQGVAMESKTVSIYRRYGQTEINVPPEAERIFRDDK